MTLKNITKKILLSEKMNISHSIKDNFFGLTLSTTPKAMLFYTRFGIHTFGMKYPIDVLVVDKKYTVVAIKQTLQPNRVFLWNPRFTIVIEIPENTVRRTKTEIGDTLHIS